METNLALQPELYHPAMDDLGNYVDYCPTPRELKCGVKCPCGTRAEHIIYKKQAFSSHISTAKHKKWLEILNSNKTNYYREAWELRQNVHTQRLIIANYERQITEKNELIALLTKQINAKELSNSNVTLDLLSFD